MFAWGPMPAGPVGMLRRPDAPLPASRRAPRRPILLVVALAASVSLAAAPAAAAPAPAATAAATAATAAATGAAASTAAAATTTAASSPPALASPLALPLPNLLPGLAQQAAGAPSTGPRGTAYWLVSRDGGIFTFGGVPFEGSAGGVRLGSPVIGMAATAGGRGYWLATAAGGVYTYGTAQSFGAPGALPQPLRPSSPVSAIAATGDGLGYWLATAGGGVYAFGDAPFAGSLGALHLTSPIVGMAPTPDGGGYWLVAADGSVFSFGDAPFEGSAYPIHLAKPIVGMAATPSGSGYWLVASDGGIFAFGDATFHGSTGAIALVQPIVGMSRTPSGHGYWLVASDGGIFAFGDAPFRGSTGAMHLTQPVVGMAAGPPLDPYAAGTTGYDISWPQCGHSYPPAPVALGIVGANGGKAFTHNPCLASQAAWAGQPAAIYINLNSPPTGSPDAQSGPAGACAPTDTGCMAYNYGYNAAVDTFGYATASGASSGVWWLDVETANTWDPNTANNDLTIKGALDALTTEGVIAGIYSTGRQFSIIAGAYAPATPVWRATGGDFSDASTACGPGGGFGGGTVWLAQYGTPGFPFDQDLACQVD